MLDRLPEERPPLTQRRRAIVARHFQVQYQKQQSQYKQMRLSEVHMCNYTSSCVLIAIIWNHSNVGFIHSLRHRASSHLTALSFYFTAVNVSPQDSYKYVHLQILVRASKQCFCFLSFQSHLYPMPAKGSFFLFFTFPGLALFLQFCFMMLSYQRKENGDT